MIPDPARQLHDIGRRVLRIVEPPLASAGFDLFPDAYENLLLDPMVTLSDTCKELLEAPDTAPGASDPGVQASSALSGAVAETPTAGAYPHVGPRGE
ncbi:MAG: hypothetical protein M3151_00310, partial [Actinomycetota bacterium]|nr:hypothetical protein [Actinomycetota bacterium]